MYGLSNPHFHQETEFTSSGLDSDITIESLHRMCAQGTTMMQDLEDMESTIVFLQEAYDKYKDVFCWPDLFSGANLGPESSLRSTTSDRSCEVNDSLHYLRSRCSMHHGWTTNYLNRTKTRIQLVS